MVSYVPKGVKGGDLILTCCSWDVARAIQWIFTYCNVDGLVAGVQSAGEDGEGNPALRIAVNRVGVLVQGFE